MEIRLVLTMDTEIPPTQSQSELPPLPWVRGQRGTVNIFSTHLAGGMSGPDADVPLPVDDLFEDHVQAFFRQGVPADSLQPASGDHKDTDSTIVVAMTRGRLETNDAITVCRKAEKKVADSSQKHGVDSPSVEVAAIPRAGRVYQDAHPTAIAISASVGPSLVESDDDLHRHVERANDGKQQLHRSNSKENSTAAPTAAANTRVSTLDMDAAHRPRSRSESAMGALLLTRMLDSRVSVSQVRGRMHPILSAPG